MKTLLNKPIFRYSALLITGVLIGALLFGGFADRAHLGHDHVPVAQTSGGGAHGHNHGAPGAQNDEPEETIWTCSMHPQIRSNEPGSCPLCGMDLTPAAAGGSGDVFTLVMTEEAVALSSIMTSAAVLEVPVREIRMPGRVVAAEDRISSITANTAGRITTQRVGSVGQVVRAGEVLGTIWSPELVTAQQELLDIGQSQDMSDTGVDRMLEAARTRLEFMGLTRGQIAKLEEIGQVVREVELLSPSAGVVLARNVRTQDYVSAGTVMYEIADLGKVWVDLEAWEQDVQWLKTGDVVRYTATSQPGGVFAGRISWIDPVVNPSSRTVRVRLEAENASGQWRPDMLVRGEVLAESRSGAIVTVPSSAVLWTGTRSLVYVQVPGEDVPTFESREVLLGERFGDRWAIRDGLDAGERVVSNGVFTVDAEFQLRDKFSMMNRDGVSAPSGTLRRASREEADADVGPSGSGTGAGTAGTGSGSGSGSDAPGVDGAGAGAQSTDYRALTGTAFRTGFTGVLDAYMDVKDALVASDAGAAAQASRVLRERVEALDEGALRGEAQMAWLGQREELRRQLLAWSRSGEIEHQRTHLYALSGTLFDIAQSFGIQGVVYQQFCPMAFNDAGANWLSREQQIRNPYLSETMLGCGEVLQVIR
jgi:Cu(I)/Ag(I) efflux system membrane fusion protein